ncbi:diguanylate cyclase [Natronococcus pandeyae]|uniref:Diguanylate cyclase n=1 Tax=Natronococcus pandeyae TaxID=2055836 RepID=A0A8J8Q4X7_9EURY|nr:bacterio-opsin activator domain-containing protein [Natronococcus pandeyae]TYL38877.1 diguanylate cyclase [Natronococcus pandeyae]
MVDIHTRLADPFFNDVVATVTDGVVLLDSDGTIVFANPHVTELLGYESEALLEQPIATLFPNRGSAPLETIRKQAASSTDQRPRGVECSLVHESGEKIPVALTAAEVDDERNQYLAVTFQVTGNRTTGDRTPQQTDSRTATKIEIDGRPSVFEIAHDDFEQEVYEAQLEALSDASRKLYTASTKTAVAQISVELVQTILGRSYAAVWLCERDEEVLEPAAASSPVVSSATDDSAVTAIAPIRSGTIEMEIFRDGDEQLIDGYHEIDRPAHPEIGLEKRLVVPLGEYGLLTVGSTGDDTIDDSLRNLVDTLASTILAAFDRLAAEAAIRHRSAAMESSMDGIGISDDRGVFRYVNRALADLHGYDDPAELVGTSWQVLFPDGEVERLEREVMPVVLEEGSWRGEALGERADGSQFHQEHSLTLLEDGIVCVTRDVTERKSWEQQLEGLNEIARELMSGETRDEIGQIGVEAVENVLDFEIACVRLFDRDANRLRCVALTEGGQTLLETRAAYDLEGTLAGRAFRNDETLVNVIPETDLSEPASVFENSSLHVPIGSYGVLSVLVRDDEAFDGSDVHLTEMLAMAIGAALARADRTRLLRTQERELRQQHDQLETLNRINAVNNEISTGLIAATTREELDRTICEHLVESDFYRSAWIGRIEGSGDRIGMAIGVGIEDSYLDAVTKTPLSRIAGGTVERAIETAEMQVVRQYHVTDINGTGESDEDVEAIAAIPLMYGERTVGVLVVNSVRDDVFCEDAIAGFESLGKIVGFAKNAIKSRELLLSDSIVELEFILSDPSVFYVQVSAELDCRCEFQRAVPIENGRIITYDVISGAEPADVLEVAEDTPNIERARVVSKQDGRFVLQTVTSRSMVRFGLEMGTTVRSAVAENGEGTVIVEAPQTADVREIVTAFQREFDSLELVAKRDREHPVTTADTFRESVANRLTEKQRAALESAYFAGYYDWPRKITAEELADSLGVSSSTLHQHLRRGNWCLLSTFFEDSA